MMTRLDAHHDVRLFRFLLTSALVATLAVASSALAGQHDHSLLPHNIPNFCSSPTIRSTSSGAWSNPMTWSAGRLPGAEDDVEVAPGTVVTYDVVSNVALGCIAVNGALTFQTNVNTRLTVGTLMVTASGQLTIGSEANPVSSGVTAEVVIASQPIDTTADPEQFGTGIIGLGQVTVHGARRAPGFVRLDLEPVAGQTTLALAASVTGWQPNDQLFLPDSRQVQLSEDTPPEREWPRVAEMSDRRIQVAERLRFDHLGARDATGHLDFLPHVANLTRNVVIRSANPSGTRGHVLLTYRAVVDIRYAAFVGLGRTQVDPLDVTTFDDGQNVTHIGTNQIGRYALHLHHVFGSEQPQSTGFQAVLVGNVVQDAAKWGIVVHNTHYTLVRDNVVVHTGGAGIVTEAGNESFNVIEKNFAAVAGPADHGAGGLETFPQDFGHQGAFWLRGVNNYVRDNVAADCGDRCWEINLLFLTPTLQFPIRPGVDPDVEGTALNPLDMPILEFARNEGYAANGVTGVGMVLWSVGFDEDVPDMSVIPESVIKDFRLWNIPNYGYDGTNGYINRVTFDGLVIRGDASQTVASSEYTLPTGLEFSGSMNVVIRRADIQGMQIGVFTPEEAAPFGAGVTASGQTVIEDSYFRNYISIAIPPLHFYQPQLGWRSPAKTTLIRNTRFGEPLPGAIDLGEPGKTIKMFYVTQSGDDLIQRDTVLVQAYNGVAGDDFQVLYLEQAPSSIVPQTEVDGGDLVMVGAPEAGYTNAQAWARWGIAVAGLVAPCNATRPEIYGFVCR